MWVRDQQLNQFHRLKNENDKQQKIFVMNRTNGSHSYRNYRINSLANNVFDFCELSWVMKHIQNRFFLCQGDGALLPSPTREKLEPVIPRRREDVKEHRDEIQPRMKSSPKNSPRTGRSQSLGPTVTDRRSPKRQPPRAPSVTKDARVR